MEDAIHLDRLAWALCIVHLVSTLQAKKSTACFIGILYNKSFYPYNSPFITRISLQNNKWCSEFSRSGFAIFHWTIFISYVSQTWQCLSITQVSYSPYTCCICIGHCADFPTNCFLDIHFWDCTYRMLPDLSVNLVSQN